MKNNQIPPREGSNRASPSAVYILKPWEFIFVSFYNFAFALFPWVWRCRHCTNDARPREAKQVTKQPLTRCNKWGPLQYVLSNNTLLLPTPPPLPPPPTTPFEQSALRGCYCKSTPEGLLGSRKWVTEKRQKRDTCPVFNGWQVRVAGKMEVVTVR